MIGFIGAGNVANAIINGLLNANYKPSEICIYDIHKDKTDKMKQLGISVCSSGKEVAEISKFIFLSIKPNTYKAVLEDIVDSINDDSVIITMAAGFSIDEVKKIVGDKKVTRIMPNTPALVGSGFTAVCFDDKVNESEKQSILDIMNAFGKYEVIEEKSISAYTAVTGSGPAYVFMIMEAMADAAVLLGMPRKEAYTAVQSTLIGSAKMAMESGLHPGALKDMVCSPGGTTIEGLRTLEERGLRSAIIECIINTYKKNNDMSKIR